MAAITPHHEQIAESIIATEGMVFAIAVHGGSVHQIAEARQFLKTAIAQAIANEHSVAWVKGYFARAVQHDFR